MIGSLVRAHWHVWVYVGLVLIAYVTVNRLCG